MAKSHLGAWFDLETVDLGLEVDIHHRLGTAWTTYDMRLAEDAEHAYRVFFMIRRARS
jgi:hypothetical protein